MKPLKFVISPIALEELETIQDELSNQLPRRDQKFTLKLRAAIDRLCLFPEIGTERPDLFEGIRVTYVWNYLVFYQLTDDQIVIERVLHGARDIEALFKADDDD
jgi:toxin ParE1/3/4